VHLLSCQAFVGCALGIVGAAAPVTALSLQVRSSTTTSSTANYIASSAASLRTRRSDIHLHSPRISQPPAGRFQHAMSFLGSSSRCRPVLYRPVVRQMVAEHSVRCDPLRDLLLSSQKRNRYSAALAGSFGRAPAGSSWQSYVRLPRWRTFRSPSVGTLYGTFSYSGHHQGTCSWHRGVAVWNPKVPWRRI
jgi:hypothetical protein